MKSGFVSIIGRSNAGKSSLINAILEAKLAIVTPKEQTTRDIIRGIYDDEEYQIVFIDTPGIHKANTELGKSMNKNALNSLKEVDATILMVDAKRKFDEQDKNILDSIPKDIPLFVVLNKIDLITISEAEEIKKIYSNLLPMAKIIEMSILDNFNVDYLLDEVKKVMKEGPRYYQTDEISDKDSSFFIKEVIREKLLLVLRDEVPHHLAVKVDKIANKKEATYIKATIIVDRDSHKGIVIGKDGKRIKIIATKAREELEEYYNRSIYLEIFVSVKKDWINNNQLLKELGYK